MRMCIDRWEDEVLAYDVMCASSFSFFHSFGCQKWFGGVRDQDTMKGWVLCSGPPVKSNRHLINEMWPQIIMGV